MDQLNLVQMAQYRPWNWKGMKGSPACLKWAFRDLRQLDETLTRVPGRSAAVQAGGNLGIFAKRLAEEFLVVYTFEPDADLFVAMTRNAPEPNIIRFQAALGCDRSPIRTECRRRDSSGKPVHEGLTHVAGPGDVPQVLVDDLNLAACDLIYLDIEGYEWKALQGAVQTIARCRPVIVTEINSAITYYGATRDELRAWICGLGYELVFRMNSDEMFRPL